MNSQEADIILSLISNGYTNQRKLADSTGFSLGLINKCINSLLSEGFLSFDMKLTQKAKEELLKHSPANAIILAAGYGMRMVPINNEIPKAFLEVNGQALIERVICQLHEVGIKNIYVVVGFKKEQFEYLIDCYGVELIVNEEYSNKNNLHSLAMAKELISNTYIIPCDIWCKTNPFKKSELYSWYMVSDSEDDLSTVRANRKNELVKITESQKGNSMIGISYLTGEQSVLVKNRLKAFNSDRKFDRSFWEETLFTEKKMCVQAKVVSSYDYTEINTYEQLRELDENSNQLKSNVISIIADCLKVDPSEIKNIRVAKKGMTNRSFLFSVNGKKYIMRVPGEGTDKLINRREEAEVYKTIADKKICDNVLYINPDNGYKITEYLEDSYVCNPFDEGNLKASMEKLRTFHNMELKVNHEFDIFKQIDFYESLWNGNSSVFRDYYKVKEDVLSLRPFIEKNIHKKCLTHIDAVPDNFLFLKDGQVRIIDWEYSGMQDPDVDIAMFCIYSLYNREQTDKLIDIYYRDNCPENTRIKIYAYISACGLLWSNWCEYKRILGVEFGEYSIRQYRYAKEYYRIVSEYLKAMEE